MNKFASELLQKKVVLNREKVIAGVIYDIVIDPANGNFIGIVVKEGFGKERLKALAEKDIIAFGLDFVLITEYLALGEVEEIVRIQNIISKKIHLIKSKVFTESGVYLGRVYDYTINLDEKRLSRLYIRGPFLSKSFSFLENKIISYEQIISIDKNKIVVADTKIRDKRKIIVRVNEINNDEVKSS
jgi:sporulation protein YlmC with PRC-barrel domain